MKGKESSIVRAALYPRVSTEEQVMHGFSLDTQEEALKSYAQERGYKVVGIYRDEGFSARKPVMKRKVMQELLEDVKARKIDIILFTKLDRWFRSVGEYHKVQEVLDKYHVTWRAILEDYQTETADGRLKVNIMLSVAENEADRTSERIKFVFRGKINRGEYCFGGALAPWGYKAEIVDGVRRLVKDPDTQDAAQAFWNKMQLYQNIHRSGKEVNEEFGLSRSQHQWVVTTRSEFFSGEFMGIKNFCPSYVDRKVWEDMQHEERRIKRTQNGRVYLFAGLIRCPICGNRLSGTYTTYRGKAEHEVYSYRCNQHQVHACSYRRSISENILERYLLSNLSMYLENTMVATCISAAPQKSKSLQPDIDKLREKLRRLNNIYMSGNIADSEYEAQAASIKAEISKASEQRTEDYKAINLSSVRKLIDSDFAGQYSDMTREQQQRFWRSIILEIHLNDKEVSEIIFNL